MSKRKQQSKSPSAPLIAIIIGGIVLLAAAIYLSVAGRNNTGGTPEISVDQSTIDYGTVQFDTPLSFKVRVTNTGDGTLRFKSNPVIEVVEGC